jgi:glycogen debranching enzyme
MFTGWGVRTLASSMGAYNPMSYHNGSVWPHDSAIVAAGLMRYGFVEEAQAIAVGLLDAARAFGGRLPELFCGFDRAEFATPVAYPSSCSPQAWAAASPFSLLRTLLRFDPSVPEGQLWLAPALPPEFGDLKLTNVPLGGRNGHRLHLEVRDTETSVEGLSSAIELIERPRPVLSELKTD